MRYWLFKSEPDCFSFADLVASPGRSTGWDGVRNFQARNFLRDDIAVGDGILYYHSGANPPAIAGLAEVVEGGHPDPTAFDPSADHPDPRSRPESPTWVPDQDPGHPAHRPAPGLAQAPGNPRTGRHGVAPQGEPVEHPAGEARRVARRARIGGDHPADHPQGPRRMARIEHAALFAENPTHLKDFYTQSFGLRVVLDNGAGTPPGYFLGDDHGTALEIIGRPPGASNVNQRFVCHVAFVVDDVPSKQAELERRGLTFEPDTAVDNESMTTAFCNDPAGNRIQIVKRKRPLGV